MDVKIIAPGDKSLQYIAEHMDPMDAAELGSIGDDKFESLKDCVASSYECFVAVLDGKPWAAFGVAASGEDGEVGVPWLISTGFGRVPTGFRRYFLKLAIRTVERWQDRHMLMVNYVYTKHVVAQRWLKWMGFTVDTQPQLIGPGVPVFRFHWRTPIV